MTFSERDNASSAVEHHLNRFALCCSGFTKLINNRLEVFSEIKSFEIGIPVPIINLIVKYKSDFERAEWILKVKARALFMALRFVRTEDWTVEIMPIRDDDEDDNTNYMRTCDRILDETGRFDSAMNLEIQPLYCELTQLYVKFDEDMYDRTLQKIGCFWYDMKSNLEDLPFVPYYNDFLEDIDETGRIMFNVIHMIPMNLTTSDFS